MLSANYSPRFVKRVTFHVMAFQEEFFDSSRKAYLVCPVARIVRRKSIISNFLRIGVEYMYAYIRVG